MVGGTQAFKQSSVGILREYFLSADTAEVATAFTELGKPDLHHIFVKQVCALLQRVFTYYQAGDNPLPQRSFDRLSCDCLLSEWHVMCLEIWCYCALLKVKETG